MLFPYVSVFKFLKYHVILVTILIYTIQTRMSGPRIVGTAQIKVNITSSIDVSPDESYFSAVTRRRADNSSMYSYQLELYDLPSLKLKNYKAIYDSYNEQKHPCKITADGNTIAVATKYHVVFYDQNLNVKFKALHRLTDIYDMGSSPDSKLVCLVGDMTVLLWDSTTFKSINFPYPIPTARQCKFSPDNRYIGVSSSSFVTLFQITPVGDTYEFTLIPSFKAEDSTDSSKGFGSFTSFDFNPKNSLQIVIGFGNASPRIYSFDGSTQDFVKISSEDQPSYMNNFKVVEFMPDGKRVFSSDYLQGVGLWPGDSTKGLLYKQNFLFFGPKPFDGGRKVLGYNWQTIKVVQIQFPCSASNYATSCPCGTGTYFDLSTQGCKNCQQGSVNVCQCSSSQKFDPNVGKCIYNCANVKSSIPNVSSDRSDSPCFCKRGYTWKNGQCIFDCDNVIFSTSPGTLPQSCECQPGFTWDNVSKYCSCAQNSQLVRTNNQLSCNCLNNFKIDPTTRKCVPLCISIKNSANSTDSQGNCLCKQGYIFQSFQDLETINNLNNEDSAKNQNRVILSALNAGCVRNCSASNYTQGIIGTDNCQCNQNMLWSADHCKLDCPKITNAIELVKYPNGTQSCTCAKLYNWVWQNFECGRNCENIGFVNSSKFATALSCPCINKFEWDEAAKQCIINCEKVKYSESYSVKNNYSCTCRNLFQWEEQNMACVVNCSQIWDADSRVSEGECSCNNGKNFNKTEMICQADSIQGVFNKPWVWALVGIGGLFLIIVAVVLIRYCWNFSSSKQNKEHQKKLKKNKEPKIRKKVLSSGQQRVVFSERATLNTKQ